MTLPAPTYDLVLLLDPQVEDDARAKIVADAVTAIEAQGELVGQDEWGERALTYPIDRHPNADYRLLQFHVSEKDLLASLDRTMRLTDAVLRHRIIKLKPGTPEAPSLSSTAPAPPTATSEAPAAAEAPPATDAPAADEAQAPPAPVEAAEAAPAEASAIEPSEAPAPADQADPAAGETPADDTA
ncbi:MAG: rpsF [Solirubrobacterales bacterium]|nr:rpsF [Solirubrobacterales bacterium]